MIIERYISRNYIGPFFFSISIITFVFIMDFIIRYIDLFLEKGVAFHIVLQAFILSLGHMFALIIPMAVLPTTLMSYGNLASENEITAMKASGISLYRMILPGVIAASLLTVGLVYYNSHVLPDANHRLLNLLIDIRTKKPAVDLEPNQSIDAFKGHTIYFREKNDRTGEIRDVQIVKHASRGVYPTTINSRSGVLKFLEAENVLRFDLVDGEIHELPVPKDLSTYRRTKFEKYTINIKDVDRSLRRTERKHRGDRELSVADMKEKITGLYADIDLADVRITRAAEARMNATFDLLDAGRRAEIFGPKEAHSDSAAGVAVKAQANRRLSKAALRVQNRRGGGRNVPFQGRNEFVTRQEIETQINTKKSFKRQINRYRVEIHKKYSIPFACIIFVLVGTPLALRTGRSGMNTAIGFSILFFLVYYVCLIGGEKLADRGIISPVAAMWAPNLFFGVLAVVLLRSAAKEQSVGDWRFSNLLKVFIRRDVSTNTR